MAKLTTKYPDGSYTLTQKQGKNSSLFELSKDGEFIGYICMSDIIKVAQTTKQE